MVRAVVEWSIIYVTERSLIGNGMLDLVEDIFVGDKSH